MIKYIKFIYFLLFICFISFSFDFVEAKNVIKECNYTFSYGLNEDGSVNSGAPASQGGTINLKIYDDGSHEGKGKSNGKIFSEDFGGKENILNWSSSADGVSAVNNKECPIFIGVIVQGLGERKWYGFNENNIHTEGPKIAGNDNSNSMWVLKWDDYKTDSFTCEYDSFKITVDLFNKDIYIKTNEVANLKMFYYVSDSLKKYWLEDKEKKECTAIYSCSTVTLAGTNMYLYPDQMSAYADNKNYTCEMHCLTSDKDCEQTDCPTTTLYKQEIEKYYMLYQSSKKSSDIVSADRAIINLKNVCNTISSNLDYGEPCLNDCLEFGDWLENKKEEYGVSAKKLDGKCGFSWDLINWIANIVKWLKYIIPVIVIVLGILDFIKAIASEKEDEMKKAQGKFIKRLIVAGLVFIMPFIIEFVLNKMGFDANGCGIIDL